MSSDGQVEQAPIEVGKPLFLLKFGQREHMEEFRSKGVLYMNPLDFFISHDGDEHIADRNEGLDSCYQADRVSLKISMPGHEPVIISKNIKRKRIMWTDHRSTGSRKISEYLLHVYFEVLL